LSNVLAYDAASYRNKIRMTSIKHLLVEGKDDKKLFMVLLEEYAGKEHGIQIDSADRIRFGNDIGNRERVEQICDSFVNTSHSHKILGFVDREFRGFEIGENLCDLLNSHQVNGRTVWSRGHSVENYYFDFNILRKPLRGFTSSPLFDKALILFESNFDEIIRSACAVSLAGYQIGAVNIIRGSIDMTSMKMENSKIVFDTVQWQRFMITKQSIQISRATEIIDSFHIWLERIKKIDNLLPRWLCHGHIGMVFIWSAYAACVFEVCKAEGMADYQKEAKNVLKAEESVRFNICADIWTQSVCSNQCEHPLEIFKEMGLLTS